MLSVDLHVHSLFSGCGLHTILELLEHGRRIGLKAMAITDHGSASGGRLTSVFFERFVSPFSDIQLYKGIELNIVDEAGATDLPMPFMPFIDVLLLGIHPNTPQGKSRKENTDLLLAAMEKNPFVDIISHPNDPMYSLDYRRLAVRARELGMALECNNSKVLYNRCTEEEAAALIFACKEASCPMAVSSDTHALLELGRDESVRPILKQAGFPPELIINRDPAAAAAFIEGRRRLKKNGRSLLHR